MGGVGLALNTVSSTDLKYKKSGAPMCYEREQKSRPAKCCQVLIWDREMRVSFFFDDDDDERVSGTQDPRAGKGRQSGSYWYDAREAGKCYLLCSVKSCIRGCMRNSRVGRAQQPNLGRMHTDGTVEVAGVSDGWPGRAWVFGWIWMEHKVLYAWSLIYGGITT